MVRLKTTAFKTILGDNSILTGEEAYPLIEPAALGQEAADALIAQMAGLRVNWDCIEKAKIVRKFLHNKPVVMAGGMLVVNKEKNGSYGYYYNPPFEFHAWAQDGRIIYDFALPGVILSGLDTKDEYGPILQDMEPRILAGEVPRWIIYKAIKVLEE